MSPESETKQHARDMEYLRACREAGIDPQLPEYEIRSNRGTADASERAAMPDDCGTRNNSKRLARLPLTEIEARELEDEQEAKRTEREKIMREAMGKVLDILLVGASPNTRGKIADSARASALRIITMAWMVQRGPLAGLSLSTLAKHLDCTRAALSWHARNLEKATGVHGRGQKLANNVPKYREARFRYLRRSKGEALELIK